MYPLKAVILGSGADADQIGQALIASGVEIERRFLDLPSLRQAWPDIPAEPRLLVSVLKNDDDLLRFRQVCDALSGWPTLVAVGGDYDAQILFRINRAGAVQMLPLPWIPEDLHASLDRLAAQYGLYPRPGKCIAVYGVVDGGGAAHIAANLAYEIAETWHQSTILAEPASSIGVLAELFDLSPAQTTEDLYHTGIPTREKVRQTAARVTDRLLLLPGPHYKFPADPQHQSMFMPRLKHFADPLMWW